MMSCGMPAVVSAATPAVGSVAALVPPVPEQPSILSRTKMCKFFAQGRCKKGVACTYAHSREALRPAPDLSCTKLCPKRAACMDAHCKFAHRRAELRGTDEVARRAAATMRMPLCLAELCAEAPQRPQQPVVSLAALQPLFLTSTMLPLKPAAGSLSPTAGSRSRSESVASTGSTDGSSLDDEDASSDASPTTGVAAHEVRRLARLLPKVDAQRYVHNTFVDFEDHQAEHVQRVQICGDLYTCRPHGRFSEITPV